MQARCGNDEPHVVSTTTSGTPGHLLKPRPDQAQAHKEHADPADDEAARRLSRNHISGAPVVEHGKVVGVISETDIVRALSPGDGGRRTASILDWLTIGGTGGARCKAGTLVADAMSPIGFQIPERASVWEAATILDRRGINRLPVVDDEDYLVGIVSRADLVRVMGRDDGSLEADVEEEAPPPAAFLLDAALGLINIEQNAIIKIFSVVAVVFLPPTLIASVYGMNFAFMPELHWVFGYPLALALMVGSALAPLLYFRRRGWL